MKRMHGFLLAGGVMGTMAAATSAAAAVTKIKYEDVFAHASQNGKAVVATLTNEAGHGHVVLVVPGSNPPRFYDGNIAGALKDLSEGRHISNPRVEKKLRMYLTKKHYPREYRRWASTAESRKSLAHLKGAHELLNGLSAEERRLKIQKWIRDYSENGNSRKLSYNWSRDEGNIQYYTVPRDPQAVKAKVQNFEPGRARTAALQNLRCNELYKQVLPRILPKDKPATANNIASDLEARARAAQARRRQAAEAAQAATPEKAIAPTRPPEPTMRKIYENKSREKAVVPKPGRNKPGGVIITARARIKGFGAADVKAAVFDPAAGTVAFALKDGRSVVFRTDADAFVVAVRSVFGKRVDPSLSMSFSDKPGYHSVDYSGPLFKTRFGKVLYETDSLLGLIIFNRVGPHRDTVTEIIPDYPVLTCESSRTMTTSSRVFLHGYSASFEVANGELVCTGVMSRIEVEGLRHSATYYQEPLVRLARVLDENFDDLAFEFPVFRAFRKLTQAVAIAKWLKVNRIDFDHADVARQRTAEHTFPAYSPSIHWYAIFNGRNLDGWRTNAAARDLNWSDRAGLTLSPSGGKPVEAFFSTWAKEYDVRLSVRTEGPVEFVASNDPGAAVTADTKGDVATIEMFRRRDKWTVLAPGASKKGAVAGDPPRDSDKKKARRPNEFGLRIPPGSRVTIYRASRRNRPAQE